MLLIQGHNIVALLCEIFCLHAGEGWVRSMIAAGATTLAPVLGRMVSNPAGGPRPPSASKGSTSSSESCFQLLSQLIW